MLRIWKGRTRNSNFFRWAREGVGLGPAPFLDIDFAQEFSREPAPMRITDAPFLAASIVIAITVIAILYLYDPILLQAWTHRIIFAR